MALSFMDNVDYRGLKPNFTRDQFTTIAEMAAFNEDYLPETFIATCIEDGKAYLFNKANEKNDTLGKWRLLNPAGEGASVLTADVTAASNIGGIAADRQFKSGTSLEDIITELLAGAKNKGNKYYYALSDDINVDFDVDTIYQVLKPSVKITAHNQYILFIFPADKELAIFDTNGLNNTGSFNISDFEIEGVAYKVYSSEAKVTCVDYEYKLTY